MPVSDEKFMRRTFVLAKRGLGFVSPNPLVGAVIVKNGKILAEDWHQKYGGPHAERAAILKLAGKKSVKNCARGATLYVNLEPCSHHGKTPPCTDIIIEAGIKRVVFAVRDPNPKVRRLDPVRILKKAGIKVVYPVLKKEACELNKVFFKNQKCRLPYVTLKSAVTTDGKIAAECGLPCARRRDGRIGDRPDARGKTKWITCADSRAAVHRLRLEHDAVLVGKNTVLKDNPRLNIRLPGIKKENHKIILGNRKDFPKNTKLLRDSKAIFVVKGAANSSPLGLTPPPAIPRGELFAAPNLKSLLSNLYKKHKICSVLVEGGAAVNTSFLKSGLIDEWLLFIAPKILGKNALPVFHGNAPKKFQNAQIQSAQKIGKDILLKIALINV